MISSVHGFAELGMMVVAYIKPITTNDGMACAVHAADGSLIGHFANRDMAALALRHHQIEPVSVH